MTDVTLRVVGSDLATPIAALDQPYGIEWADEGLDSGALSFSIPHDSPIVQDNPTILGRDNLVVLSLDSTDRLGFLIRRRQRTRGDVWDPINVSAIGVLEVLRSALVEYARGVGIGVPSDERPFGWMAVDYDDSGGCWVSPPPYSGGQWREPRFATKRDNPPSFPDERAEWIGPQALAPNGNGGQGHPGDDYWYLRHRLVGPHVGEAKMFVAADDGFLAYFNGSQIAEGEDFRRLTTVDLVMTGDDVLAIEVYNAPLGGKTNNPTEIVYTIATVDEDGEVDTVLFRSTSGSVFSSSADAVQSIVLDAQLSGFPWGSSYPSPGGLTGTWRLTFRGQQTGPIAHDANAAAVKAALEALSNVSTVTVTGAGTTASPWLVTFDGTGLAARPHPTMTIEHTDLRHNHATTRIRSVTTGKAAAVSAGGSSSIRVCAFPGEPPGVTIGFILATLLDEAQNGPGRGFTTEVTAGFDATTDSRGEPWAEEVVFVCQVGNDNVLSVAERLRELGVDVWMGPDLVFHAAQVRGVDRGATPDAGESTVEFALHVAHELATESEDEIINALLVRTDDAWFRRGTPPAGTRREHYLTLGLQPNANSAAKIADANLAAMQRARQVVRFVANSAQPDAPVPYVDYGPLDVVRGAYVLPTLIAGPWALTDVRVDTIAGKVDEVGDVDYVFEVEA